MNSELDPPLRPTIPPALVSFFFWCSYNAVRLLLFKWQIGVLQPVAPAQRAYSVSFIFLDGNRFAKSANRNGGGGKRNMFGKPWQRTFLGRGPSAAARELPSQVTVVFCGLRPYLTTDRGVDRIPARVPSVHCSCQPPPCSCVYSTMITVFARKAFAFQPFFFCRLRRVMNWCLWVFSSSPCWPRLSPHPRRQHNCRLM